MRLMFVGPGRSGKDESADWFHRNTSLRRGVSTSRVILPHVAPVLGLSEEEAYARRSEFREEFAAVGDQLCKDDPNYLTRASLAGGATIGVGIRRPRELEGLRSEWPAALVVWLDRPGVPHDSTMKFGSAEADIIVPNYYGVPELHERLNRLARTMTRHFSGSITW